MEGLTTITFFKFRKNKGWAFAQMGLAPSKLQQKEGLKFFKLMGTGGGNGFSLWPDFGTYAFLGVWDNQKSADDFLKHNAFIQNYYQKSSSFRTIKMLPVKSHGLWSGQNPFPEQEVPTNDSGLPVAVITRATLRPSRLFAFWKSVPHASAAIENAAGVQYFKGIGEWPFVQQATLSLWDSFEAVKQFAYRDQTHAKIIKKTRSQKWYSEDLFARFHLLSDTGFIESIPSKK
jgi:heme-degrading monooxygenase HmoA